MKKITSMGGYDVYEVTRADVQRIRDMFPGPWTDASTKLMNNGYEVDANYTWKLEVEPALKAIRSGKSGDFFSRYPCDDVDVADIDKWEKDCMLHPLFLISAKKDAEYKNILFVVPPTEMEACYFTDNGEYWGDDKWEPLPDIIGDEKLANDILDEIYDYIDEAESPLKEAKLSKNVLKARERLA